MGKAGVARGGKTAILAMGNKAYTRIGRQARTDKFRAFIGRPIVNNDKLPVSKRLRLKVVERVGKIGGNFVTGQDDGEERNLSRALATRVSAHRKRLVELVAVGFADFVHRADHALLAVLDPHG